jgi:hypothetical protein
MTGSPSAAKLTGGCQCGAIRFEVASLGRASICYCRMCQKAFGNIGAPLVTTHGVTWTRGTLKHFRSSNRVRRGFCADCGTPMTWELEQHVDIAIATFDHPENIPPTVQLSPQEIIPWTDGITQLPHRPATETDKATAFFASIRSNQHPDGES